MFSRSLICLVGDGRCLVQSQVKSKDIHARFSKKSEVWRIRVMPNRFPHLVNAQRARFGDTLRLKFGVPGTDVRIEPTARSGDSVRGDGVSFFQAVFLAIRLD